MDYATQYLNGIKNQGMGFTTPGTNVNQPVNTNPGFPEQAQQFGGSINDMIGKLSTRNDQLKNNNYVADFLKQTGGALLKNPNAGVLAGIGEGLQQTEQLNNQREQQIQQNEMKAMELRQLMMNTQRAVAEFEHKKQSKLVDQDLHRMQIEATREHRDNAREDKLDARRHREQEAHYKRLEQGDKTFGSMNKLANDKEALESLENLYSEGKATQGFSIFSPLEWWNNKNTPEFKSENQRLPSAIRIPSHMGKDEALDDISYKISETKNRIAARKAYDLLIEKGHHPYDAKQAISDRFNLSPQEIDGGAEHE